MKKETYENIFDFLKETGAYKYIEILTTFFVYITALTYAFTFILLLLHSENGKIQLYFDFKNEKLIHFVLVPLIGFIGVTLFRKINNSKRPFEVYDFTPLYKIYNNPKKKHKIQFGKSFPSRHVFSCFIIAMAEFSIYPSLGANLFILGIWIAVFRVVMGVHFPKDVIAGALMGIILGFVGCFLI